MYLRSLGVSPFYILIMLIIKVMTKIQLFLLLLLNLNTQKQPIKHIYIGKSFSWTIYYDNQKLPKVVEIANIKFGYLDYFDNHNNSKRGKLYNKNGEIYYKNKALNIDIKLKQKKYTLKIDRQRQKLFEINAFNEISKLKDSLKVQEYKFDWNVKSDYLYYRDNLFISKDYEPDYIKKFYKSLNN